MILARLAGLLVSRCVLFVVAALLPLRLAAQNYTYFDINYPGASSGTFPYAVNDSGKVVGLYVNGDGSYHGFYWYGTNYTLLRAVG